MPAGRRAIPFHLKIVVVAGFFSRILLIKIPFERAQTHIFTCKEMAKKSLKTIEVYIFKNSLKKKFNTAT
jgi:hypothetical protein